MNIQTLIESKPPEYYNQDYWRSLSQRMAWLLQRWLNKGGDPYYYYDLLKTPLLISDETKLNSLFTGEFYHGERFVTRYIDECYWVIWRRDFNSSTYYFLLSAEHFYRGSMIDQYTFPYELDTLRLGIQREKLERLLVETFEQRCLTGTAHISV